jgi:hypothetical protein
MQNGQPGQKLLRNFRRFLIFGATRQHLHGRFIGRFLSTDPFIATGCDAPVQRRTTGRPSTRQERPRDPSLRAHTWWRSFSSQTTYTALLCIFTAFVSLRLSMHRLYIAFPGTLREASNLLFFWLHCAGALHCYVAFTFWTLVFGGRRMSMRYDDDRSLRVFGGDFFLVFDIQR